MSLDGPRAAPKSGSKPTSLMVFCHGYGSNGDDLISLAGHWAPVLPDTAFASPNAPQSVPGVPGGYQWFGISKLDPEAMAQGVRAAAPVLEAFIEAELARTGVAADRLALVGFSQGTMLALHVGLRRDVPPACILGYSGALAAPDMLAKEVRGKPPVQLIHGDADDVLPVAFSMMAADSLREAGVPVRWHISHGTAHGIAADGLAIGGRFLHEMLA